MSTRIVTKAGSTFVVEESYADITESITSVVTFSSEFLELTQWGDNLLLKISEIESVIEIQEDM